ncbi:MAG: hypothetical protein QG671_4217 [Actinomycetota bacterium]|nr:hypothetical protein [Actinomycetota bacterium]
MRRTAADAAETRRTIIRTALSTFAALGWEGGSLVVIARRAGLTRGAVYHHFESKEGLLRAVLHEEWSAQADPLLALLGDRSVPARTRSALFLDRYLTLLATDGAFRDLAVVSTVVAPQAIEIADGVEQKRDALSGWSCALRLVFDEAGPLAEGVDAERAVFVILTFLHGLTIIAATEPASLPRGETSAAIGRAVTNGLFAS